MRLRTSLLAGALVAAALVAPASAGAVTYCVKKPACVAAGGTDRVILQDALNSANASPVPDRVEIGPVTEPTASGFFYNGTGANSVEIVGSGRDQTTLTGPNTINGSFTTLSMLSSPGNRVSDLKILIPDATTNDPHTGLRLRGAAERIDTGELAADATAHASSGIELYADSSVEDCTLGSRGAGGSSGITAQSTGVIAEGCTIRGPDHGLYVNEDASATFRRIDAQGRYSGLYVINAKATIESSALRAGTASPLLGNPAAIVSRSSGKNAVVAAANVTLVGPGDEPDSDGASARTFGAGATAELTLDSSIIRGFGHSLSYGGAQPGTKLTTRYSNYDPSTNLSTGSSTSTVDQGPGNINADPLFVNPAGGDYRVQEGSPVIDAGNPTPLGGPPSSPDLGGLPRPTDGNGDGTSVPDMGAHESIGKAAPPPPPPPPPPAGDTLPPAIASPSLAPRRFRVARAATPIAAAVRGTRIRFALSEAATATFTVERKVSGRRSGRRCSTRKRTGRRCTAHKRAGRNFTRALPAGPASVRFSGRIGRKALPPGRYRLTISARDAAGNNSAKRRVAFTILR